MGPFSARARGKRAMAARFSGRFEVREGKSLERAARLTDVTAGYDNDDIPTALGSRCPPRLVNTSLRVGDTARPES